MAIPDSPPIQPTPLANSILVKSNAQIDSEEKAKNAALNPIPQAILTGLIGHLRTSWESLQYPMDDHLWA